MLINYKCIDNSAVCDHCVTSLLNVCVRIRALLLRSLELALTAVLAGGAEKVAHQGNVGGFVISGGSNVKPFASINFSLRC